MALDMKELIMNYKIQKLGRKLKKFTKKWSLYLFKLAAYESTNSIQHDFHGLNFQGRIVLFDETSEVVHCKSLNGGDILQKVKA